MKAEKAIASEPVAVPQGVNLIQNPITEDMHIAAVKVLQRAHGIDGLPQRMLDAMLSAAPATPQAQPLTFDKKYAMFCFQNTKYEGRYIDMESFYDGIEAAEHAHGITPDVSGDIGHE